MDHFAELDAQDFAGMGEMKMRIKGNHEHQFLKSKSVMILTTDRDYCRTLKEAGTISSRGNCWEFVLRRAVPWKN